MAEDGECKPEQVGFNNSLGLMLRGLSGGCMAEIPDFGTFGRYQEAPVDQMSPEVKAVGLEQ